MTGSKRLTELVELDVEAERIIETLEDALEVLPVLIFIVKASQALARRELREAGEDALAILGDRHGTVVPESAPPGDLGRQAEVKE